jgi:hypothetical protein
MGGEIDRDRLARFGGERDFRGGEADLFRGERGDRERRLGGEGEGDRDRDCGR